MKIPWRDTEVRTANADERRESRRQLLSWLYSSGHHHVYDHINQTLHGKATYNHEGSGREFSRVRLSFWFEQLLFA